MLTAWLKKYQSGERQFQKPSRSVAFKPYNNNNDDDDEMA